MRPRIPEIRGAGGDVVVIGTGTSAAAKDFQDSLGLGDIRIFSDEARRSYDLAGFRRGILPLLRPRAVRNYLRAIFAGHRLTPKQGDALQQGGVLVIRPDGTVPFRYASRASGDHPDLDMVIAAVRASTATSP